MTADADEHEPIDFRAIFEAAPSPNLIVRTDSQYTIVAANDAYLAATMTTRERIVGRAIFEAFPDNPDDPAATGVSKVRESIEHVITHRQPHTMAVQKYDVRRPDGGFEERYWSPIHTPVFGPDGAVAYVIQRPEDVTEFVRLKARAGEQDRRADEYRGRAERMEAEVFLRAQELARANADLRRQVEERERAEAALAREQDFLRAVLDHAADGIVACDADGVLRFFNRAAREFHGMAEQPLPPERWAEQYDLYLPDGKTRMTKEQVPLFRALAEGSVKDVEMVIAANRHPPRLLTASGRAITDAEDRKHGAVVVMHDLTARERGEEERERAVREEAGRKGAEASAARLAESEGRLRLILESVRDYAIFTTDPAGRVTDWNVGAERLFGYASSEIVGRGFAVLFTEEDRDSGVPAAELATAQDAGCADDIRWHRRKDGSRFFASGVTSPLRDAAGTLKGFTKICRDITEQRRLETALRESEERFRLMADAVPQIVWITDAEGRMQFFNQQWSRYTGVAYVPATADDVAATVLHPDDRRATKAAFDAALRSGNTFLVEHRIRSAAGEYRWFLVRGEPYRDPQTGRIVRWFGASVDIHDRRRAEEELRESEERARRIIDNTLAFVGVMTPDGTLTEVNATALRAGGLRREDVVGRKFWDCPWWSYDPQVQLRLREAVSRAAGGEVVRYDVIVRMAGDTRMPIDFMLSPVKDNQGRVTDLIPSGMDIAERKRAEEQLVRSHDTFYHLIQNNPFGIYVVDADFRLREISLGAQKVFAHVPPPLLGRDFAEVLRAVWVEPFASEAIDRFRHTLDTGEPYASPRTVERRQDIGEVEAYDWRVERITLPDGRFGVVCHFYDLSERQRWEAALRSSEELVRTIAENSTQGLAMMDARGHCTYANKAWLDMTGYTAEEIGAKPLHDLVHHHYPDGRPYPIEACPIDRALPENFDVRAHEDLFFRKDGSTFPVLVAASPIFKGGRPASTVIEIRDVTEAKRAEAERERLLEAERAARTVAERAGRMKDEFLATLSHELRTPLNAILGWSQILARGTQEDEDLAEGLRTIERNARAQTQIIEDLLDMSRIISGKVRLDVQRLDLVTVVREAVATAKPSAEAKGVRIQAVLDPHAGSVSGDPARLQQVMWNLLTNAVKFTPRGGRVQVVLQRVNSHLEVSVSDSGEGIAPDFLRYVFDRFRQADATTTRRHGGLGLGLSIVKQLVELHGGTIRVQSGGTGQGATFRVALPLTVIQPEPEPKVERQHPHITSAPVSVPRDCALVAGVRVLVVDDEPDARALLKRLLEDCEAEVVAAGSVAEALDVLRRTRPQVLVSDIGMPGEDGYALIKRVRELGPEEGGRMPAIALTAYARAEDRVNAIVAGFDMHVAKPVEPAELIAMVASLAARAT